MRTATLSLDDKIATLVPEVDAEIRDALAAALRTLRLANSPAGTITGLNRMGLILMNKFYERNGMARPSLSLFDCIDKAEKIADVEKALPQTIALNLDFIRRWSNAYGHDKPVPAATVADGENALAQYVRAVEWFYCEYPLGERLESLYGGDPPVRADYYVYGNPSDYGDIVDRTDDLAALRTAILDPRYRLLVLVGRSGVGKSALLTRTCDIAAHEELELPGIGRAPAATRCAVVDCKLLADGWSAILRGVILEMLDESAPGEKGDDAENVNLIMQKLITRCQSGRFLIYLDNLEEMLDRSGKCKDRQFHEFLAAVLNARGMGLRLVAGSQIDLEHSIGGDRHCWSRPLDGLPIEYSVEVLRDQDTSVTGRLRGAPEPLLREIAERTGGNPHVLRRILGIVRRSPNYRLQRLLEYKDVSEMISGLLETHYSRLSANAKPLLQILAVLRDPVTEDDVVDLCERCGLRIDVPEVLALLIRNNFIRYSESADTYEMHSMDQVYLYSAIEPKQRFSFHAAAGAHYASLLTGYADQDTSGTAYERFYRFEDPNWQSISIQWLRHSALGGDAERVRLQLAHIYFAAFWWEEEYVPFPFCHAILDYWESSKLSPTDHQLLEAVRKFHASYPRKSNWRQLRHHPGWKDTSAALDRLTELLAAENSIPDDDPDRQAVNAILTEYRADTLFNGYESKEDVARAADLYREAADRFALPAGYGWSTAYGLYGEAEARGDLGEYAAARAVCAEAVNAVDHPDHEAAAHIYRVATDILVSEGRLADVWPAQTLNLWEAFHFMFEPKRPDLYNTTLYGESRDRAIERLLAATSAGGDSALEAALALYGFWAPWRSVSSDATIAPARETVADWLSRRDDSALAAHIFPPIPPISDATSNAPASGTTFFNATAEAARKTMEPIIDQLREEVGRILSS